MHSPSGPRPAANEGHGPSEDPPRGLDPWSASLGDHDGIEITPEDLESAASLEAVGDGRDAPGKGVGATAGANETRQQLRGSSLLLVGRLLSVGINLVTQVLIARYLSTAAFGTFAYALSVVALVGGFVGLGFERAIPRFLPLYDEHGDRPRFLGTLVLVVGVILGVGGSIALLMIGFQGQLLGWFAPDPFTVTIVSIMILLAPIEALDTVMTDLFASFRSSRAIFFRKYVLGPVLRLLVVGILIATASGLEVLAIGYVITGLIGIALYATLLPRLLQRVRSVGDAGAPGSRRLIVPLRDIISYTVPLLTMDLVLQSMSSLNAILVGNMHGMDDVAALRVVDSTARLNSIVFSTFSILFVPAAARFFARNDRVSMRDLYWRSAAWIAVLSFPIFVLTFSLAEPLTVLLFGERYRSSAAILAVLSLARFFDAALGANGQTIRVFGGIKEIVVINVVVAVMNLVFALLLIPPFAANGAALTILLSYVVYNVLKQVALHRVTEIPRFEMAYLPVYGAIVLVAITLGVVVTVVQPPLVVSLGLAAVGSVAVVRLGRDLLHIADTFPEFMSFPGSRLLR